MRANQTELHKSRPMPSDQPTQGLSDEDRKKQRDKATCYMLIKFDDGNTRGFWSNEWKKPYKYLNIGDAVNEQFRLFEKYFKRHAHSAAIFDTRSEKTPGKDNKIYQFEKKDGVFKMVKPFTW